MKVVENLLNNVLNQSEEKLVEKNLDLASVANYTIKVF